MKLLQLNMWGGRLEPQILQLVKATNPDILCLQEAIDITGGNSAMFVSTEEIQAATGAEYVYMSPVFSLNYMSRKAHFGNCIISKYPIKSSETVFTGEEYNADFDVINHSFNVRNLQHVVLELEDGSALNILNHHGHHVKQHKNGDQETMRQCAVIANKIKELDGKVVLAGDFNLAPTSESIGLINKLLTNLSVEAKLETTRTGLTDKTEVCDYIFVSDEIKVKSFEALDDIVSDHKALVMDFE